MRILLDQDGPLAAFDEAFFAMCAEEGFAVDADVTSQRHRYADEHVLDDVERAAARAAIDETRWYRDLPVTPGAVEGVAALEDSGHDVWVCSKPHEENRWCRDDKAAWLAEHFPSLVGRLILAPDKSMVRGDRLLDDAPVLEQVARAVWRPVVFALPWNGEGSPWAHLPRWSWGAPLGGLLNGRGVQPPATPYEGPSASVARQAREILVQAQLLLRMRGWTWESTGFHPEGECTLGEAVAEASYGRFSEAAELAEATVVEVCGGEMLSHARGRVMNAQRVEGLLDEAIRRLVTGVESW